MHLRLQCCSGQNDQGSSFFLSSLSVKADIAADTDLLGKVVSDLQTNIAVGTSAITGTLKYVTGYTGFSGDVSEQSGNYIALHATSEVTGAVITAACGDKSTTLDSDGILIFRVVDKTKPLSFTVTADGKSFTRTFDLSGLTMNEE